MSDSDELLAEQARLEGVIQALDDPNRSLSEKAKVVRQNLSADEVNYIYSLSDEEADRAASEEALRFKRNDPKGYRSLLASLSEEERRSLMDLVAQAERRRR